MSVCEWTGEQKRVNGWEIVNGSSDDPMLPVTTEWQNRATITICAIISSHLSSPSVNRIVSVTETTAKINGVVKTQFYGPSKWEVNGTT